jgi:hypothetical protein
MKEPKKIPLDPSTPKAKSVKLFPLNKIYPEKMQDDIYMPDNDSIYTKIDNENTKKSTET